MYFSCWDGSVPANRHHESPHFRIANCNSQLLAQALRGKSQNHRKSLPFENANSKSPCSSFAKIETANLPNLLLMGVGLACQIYNRIVESMAGGSLAYSCAQSRYVPH